MSSANSWQTLLQSTLSYTRTEYIGILSADISIMIYVDVDVYDDEAFSWGSIVFCFYFNRTPLIHFHEHMNGDDQMFFYTHDHK